MKTNKRTMKRWIQLAVVALCAIVVAACGRKSVSLEDFDKPVYMLEYASGFDIKGADSKQIRGIKPNV